MIITFTSFIKLKSRSRSFLKDASVSTSPMELAGRTPSKSGFSVFFGLSNDLIDVEHLTGVSGAITISSDLATVRDSGLCSDLPTVVDSGLYSNLPALGDSGLFSEVPTLGDSGLCSEVPILGDSGLCSDLPTVGDSGLCSDIPTGNSEDCRIFNFFVQKRDLSSDEIPAEKHVE